MTRKKLKLMDDAPMKMNEKIEKDEGKTSINMKKKQERRRDARPARATLRLQRGSHMN